MAGDWRYFAGPHLSGAVDSAGEWAKMLAGTLGPQADIAGMVNDAGAGNQSLSRGDYIGALGNYGSAAAAIPMMALPGTVASVKKGVNAAADAAKALPMDEASRMARAAEQGYVDAYHGTAADINEFSNLYRGQVTKAKSAKSAHWLVDNPATASGYADNAANKAVQDLIDGSYAAERKGQWDKAHDLMARAERLEQSGVSGANVLPLKVRGNFMEYDADGRWMQDLDESQLAALTAEAKAKGYDGLKITNFVDNAGYGVDDPATHYAVFDPKNIRSRFAAFDPSKLDSKDLLASMLAAGVFGGAAYGQGGE